MTNVDALKSLYTALGGESADVANAVTIVDVLNAIATLLGSESVAATNADAIAKAKKASTEPKMGLWEQFCKSRGIELKCMDIHKDNPTILYVPDMQ